MRILGINGLGVMPSACIIIDGQLIVFSEEERISRVKNSFGLMPMKAIRYCLENLNLTLDDIDYIAFAWDCKYYRWEMPLFALKTFFTRSPKFQSSSNIKTFINEILKYSPKSVKAEISRIIKIEKISGKIPPIHFIQHHLAHAASSYYHSGMKESYIVVIDGSGENKCTSIYKGSESKIELIQSIKIPDSLGWFYQSITEYLGFTPNSHEGKTMALAAYGNPNEEILSKMDLVLSETKVNWYKHDARFSFLGTHNDGAVFSQQLVDLFGENRKSGEELTQYHKDIAFAAQLKLESIAERIIVDLSKKSDFKGNLCLAGGVTLNCKMNGKIASLDCVKNLYVPCVTGDAGTSIGAALVLSTRFGIHQFVKNEIPYFGKDYSDESIQKILENSKINFIKCDNIEDKVAVLLAENKIIGWFQGKMEMGSRALGNRSILANPINSEMRNLINLNVKNRELWRPFALSILDEDRLDFFDEDVDSPFMAISFSVKKSIRDKVLSGIHVDNTTRPQLVKVTQNPKYHELIKTFKKYSGIGAVLNTSFNNNEEPIVENPVQALKVFYTSGLDYLAIGSFLISK